MNNNSNYVFTKQIYMTKKSGKLERNQNKTKWNEIQSVLQQKQQQQQKSWRKKQNKNTNK